MNLYIFLGTLIFSIFGYLIGSISNAIILPNILYNEDIRQKGSGNAGATNTLRNYGKNIAFAVFILDILKIIFAVIITWIVKKYSNINIFKDIFLPAIGLSVIIGHIWPIYFNFRGGKGAACFVGYFLIFQWPLFLIGLLLIIFIIKKTKKVSIGSILTPLILIILQTIFMFIPGMNERWDTPITQSPPWTLLTTSIIIYLLLIIKHIPNIRRILKKEENEIT